jgi:hypothetical protein
MVLNWSILRLKNSTFFFDEKIFIPAVNCNDSWILPDSNLFLNTGHGVIMPVCQLTIRDIYLILRIMHWTNP